ncbi:hypothetical protein CSV74_11485 [Sporosarcina sp. P19]|nr:hypothetical protein CSV74_11485 [Sporosarcina sp. P19]
MICMGILLLQGKLNGASQRSKLLDLEEMHSLGGKFFFTGKWYTRFGNLLLRFQQKDRFTR